MENNLANVDSIHNLGKLFEFGKEGSLYMKDKSNTSQNHHLG